jgi:hypothetical protein
MAMRDFDPYFLTIQKRVASVWAEIAVPTGTTPVLQKYNYPTLGAGPNARTLTAAPTTGGGTGFPTRYVQGAEGVFSVARTGTGLWTLTLQDQWQRVLAISGNHSIAGGTANIVAITENTTLTNMTAVGGSVIGIGLLSSTATLADPTASASSIIRIRIDLQDATEP